VLILIAALRRDLHFKDYARECARLHSLINILVPGARRVFDGARSTGEHAKFLKAHYAFDGIDINKGYLRAARLKNASDNDIHADMMNFDLGRTYIMSPAYSARSASQTLRWP
jgi:hypothetical protein